MTTSAPALWPAVARADRTFPAQSNRGRPAVGHPGRTAATPRHVISPVPSATHTPADMVGHCPVDDGQLRRADLALWRVSGARFCQLWDLASGRAGLPAMLAGCPWLRLPMMNGVLRAECRLWRVISCSTLIAGSSRAWSAGGVWPGTSCTHPERVRDLWWICSRIDTWCALSTEPG